MRDGVLGKHVGWELTTVKTRLQPQLQEQQLTCVDMATLQERVKTAFERGKISPAQAARACGISAAAVSKWLSGGSKEIKAEHVFVVARMGRVDAEWLATGKGRMEPKESGAPSDIPQHRLDLIRMYGRLPEEVRFSIRGLITTLAAAQSERYAKWSSAEQERNVKRDAKRPAKV